MSEIVSMSETAELVNRIAASDLCRWYGYRFVEIEDDSVWIEDGFGIEFQLSIWLGQVLCSQPDEKAKAFWIQNVLNGASLECKAGH